MILFVAIGLLFSDLFDFVYGSRLLGDCLILDFCKERRSHGENDDDDDDVLLCSNDKYLCAYLIFITSSELF